MRQSRALVPQILDDNIREVSFAATKQRVNTTDCSIEDIRELVLSALGLVEAALRENSEPIPDSSSRMVVRRTKASLRRLLSERRDQQIVEAGKIEPAERVQFRTEVFLGRQLELLAEEILARSLDFERQAPFYAFDGPPPRPIPDPRVQLAS